MMGYQGSAVMGFATLSKNQTLIHACYAYLVAKEAYDMAVGYKLSCVIGMSIRLSEREMYLNGMLDICHLYIKDKFSTSMSIWTTDTQEPVLFISLDGTKGDFLADLVKEREQNRFYISCGEPLKRS